MKTNTMLRSALSASLAAALLAATAACGSAEALPVKALQPKQVEENPYMAKSPPFTSTATATRSFRCSAASPSAI